MKILVLRTNGIEAQEDSLEIEFTSFNYAKIAATVDVHPELTHLQG